MYSKQYNKRIEYLILKGTNYNKKLVIYIYIVIVILFWWRHYIPSRNLDEVFTYIHMAIMFKSSLVLRHT